MAADFKFPDSTVILDTAIWDALYDFLYVRWMRPYLHMGMADAGYQNLGLTIDGPWFVRQWVPDIEGGDAAEAASPPYL